jgi:hypothetical protein
MCAFTVATDDYHYSSSTGHFVGTYRDWLGGRNVTDTGTEKYKLFSHQ